MSKTTTYHVCIDLRTALRFSDVTLGKMLVDRKTKKNLPARRVREMLLDALKKGFEVLPMCGKHNEKGHCAGHVEDPDLDYGQVVIVAQDLRRKGWTFNNIANELMERKYRTLRGKTCWNVGTVWKICHAVRPERVSNGSES